MNAGEGKTEINERISRWQFDYPQQQDRDEHLAVTAAANFIRQHPIRFRSGRIPSRPSEIAVLAVKCYEVFLNSDRPDAEIAEAIVEACRNFDPSSPG
jgi:hypothetical protein